jgi:hypothetical protein
MMIHVCDRCHNRQEVETGEEAKGWRDGMCEGCATAYAELKEQLNEFNTEVLRAYYKRERQPELKKLW